jgi:hypothetical protein
MSTDENKALFRRFIAEVMNRHNLNVTPGSALPQSCERR